MPNPSSSGLFLHAVEAIYDAAPDPSRWPQALGAISEYFDDVGAILIWHRNDGSFGTIVSERLAEAQRDYEENGWAVRDIKAIRAQEYGYFFNGEPFADRHIGYDEAMKNHPCSVQFFDKHSLGFIGGVAVSPDPHVGVALSVQRDARAKPQFSDAELEDLRKVSRHIEKSLRLSVRLLNAEVTNLGLGEALSRIGTAFSCWTRSARSSFQIRQHSGFWGTRFTCRRDACGSAALARMSASMRRSLK